MLAQVLQGLLHLEPKAAAIARPGAHSRRRHRGHAEEFLYGDDDDDDDDVLLGPQDLDDAVPRLDHLADLAEPFSCWLLCFLFLL